MSNIKILGWVVFAACMALLAIPAIQVIIRILKICSNRMDHYNLDNNTAEDCEDQVGQGKYLAVTSAPPSQPGNHSMMKETDNNSNDFMSITQNQERLNREIKNLEQDGIKY